MNGGSKDQETHVFFFKSYTLGSRDHGGMAFGPPGRPGELQVSMVNNPAPLEPLKESIKKCLIFKSSHISSTFFSIFHDVCHGFMYRTGSK